MTTPTDASRTCASSSRIPAFRAPSAGDIKDPALPPRRLPAGDLGTSSSTSRHRSTSRSRSTIPNTFRNDAEGTFHVLEASRAQYLRLNGLDPGPGTSISTATFPNSSTVVTRVACMSTCMVYDLAEDEPIARGSRPYRPASPYAASEDRERHARPLRTLSCLPSSGRGRSAVPTPTARSRRARLRKGSSSVFLKRDTAANSLSS